MDDSDDYDGNVFGDLQLDNFVEYCIRDLLDSFYLLFEDTR